MDEGKANIQVIGNWSHSEKKTNHTHVRREKQWNNGIFQRNFHRFIIILTGLQVACVAGTWVIYSERAVQE